MHFRLAVINMVARYFLTAGQINIAATHEAHKLQCKTASNDSMRKHNENIVGQQKIATKTNEPQVAPIRDPVNVMIQNNNDRAGGHQC